MPVSGVNNQGFTDANRSTTASTGGEGGNSGTRETGRGTISGTTYLERHGHAQMNIDPQTFSTQNGASHLIAEPSPIPIPTTSEAATPAAAPLSSSVVRTAKLSIRIVPAMDSFTRIPLRFDPIDRKVDDGEILVVGRHTDRLVTEHPTAIVFRSKVVSRNHAKIWYTEGQWYLQDIGSSSGTFLNHIRLSPPNTQSTPYTIKDGDIVQLGIDFRGGTEEVFRCVKMRIETNDPGSRISDYNVAAHIQLRKNLAMRKSSDVSPSSLSECSICLYPIGPGQALFVAACSHTWHFKCIRPIITEHFPLFMCPNCRQDADLEAPVDVETETWEAILRTTDPRTSSGDPGTARDPQIKMLNFQPIPDLQYQMIGQREAHLPNEMHSLSLNGPNKAQRTLGTPDDNYTLTRTVSPSLSPNIDNDTQLRRSGRDNSIHSSTNIGISRRVRALSATREGDEDLAGLSATPTIDTGPFVYGDMTVNADGSAEATTSSGNVVQLPSAETPESGSSSGTQPC